MITDTSSQSLHDRATRGEHLTGDERQRLDAWYAAQDQAESIALASVAGDTSLARLRENLEAATAELRAAAERIQRLEAENDALRREVADLQRRLPQQLAATRT